MHVQELPEDLYKIYMAIKDQISTLIPCNPAVVDGIECVNSKGGVSLIHDNGRYAVELEYDFDYKFTGELVECVREFRRLAAQ